jgi:hypothetical protein
VIVPDVVIGSPLKLKIDGAAKPTDVTVPEPPPPVALTIGCWGLVLFTVIPAPAMICCTPVVAAASALAAAAAAESAALVADV